MSPAAVLPLDDHAVWLCDRISRSLAIRSPEQKPEPVRPSIAGPVGDLASLALDKRQQLRCAEAAGLDVPASADAASEPPPGAGPWMVKPALAVELRGRRLARPVGKVASTHAEVRDAAAAIGGPAIAQPLINGTGEGVFGFAASGRRRGTERASADPDDEPARLRLERMPLHSSGGRAGRPGP